MSNQNHNTNNNHSAESAIECKTSTFTNHRQANIQPSNVTKSAIVHRSSTNNVPEPGPRRKHPIQSYHPVKSIGQETTTINIEHADTKKELPRLVNFTKSREEDSLKPVEEKFGQLTVTNSNNGSSKRQNHNDVPVEYVTDEGVDTTHIDYEVDNDIDEEYYDDDDCESNIEHADELTDLSRQSMVPLHELIAYYQYIQQGSSEIEPKTAVSRNSSNASTQCTTKLPVLDEGQNLRAHRITTDDIDAASDFNDDCDEAPVKKAHVPRIHIEGKAIEDDSVNSRTDVAATLHSSTDNQSSSQQQAKSKSDVRRIRSNVISELINSERDFVKHLRDVVEGYLNPARRHPEIFTGERINAIFANIEQLYEFQTKFLNRLEQCINWEDLALSEVGHCFLEHEKEFSVYHHYCNNHPNATSELQDLYTKPRFVKFFEACRVLQNMIDISLDGFLLTPIQKICKYPLQLNELLKNTDETHADYHNVVMALDSMRNCANLANERKRRIEALADVMSFQEKVESWFGPKLSDTSSILIHSGEIPKMASHIWSQGVQLYLFDHLLLFTKKDLLKRNNLILKGRVNMDTITEISDADEYKPKRSFKLFCSEQQRWFVFITRSEKEKDEWIKAFERERNLVEADENEGFHITEREIGVARRALQNRKHSRSARYRHKRPDTAIVDHIDIDDANMIMNRTLSLPSCIHPSHVMNFVEDSKVISTRKKSSSPSSNSRSPVASSQHLADQIQESQSGAGNWFKKMGSKKLAKSQVYNINGCTGTGTSITATSPVMAKLSYVNSPVNSSMSTSITSPDNAATKYDLLEKRHRDHMVSEEQARLFRLNNDLPPGIFSHSSKVNSSMRLSPSSTSQLKDVNTDPNSSDTGSKFRPEPPRRTYRASLGNIHSQQAGTRDFQSLIPSSESSKDRYTPYNEGNETGTYETTVVLSSGRVVRVREDAV